MIGARRCEYDHTRYGPLSFKLASFTVGALELAERKAQEQAARKQQQMLRIEHLRRRQQQQGLQPLAILSGPTPDMLVSLWRRHCGRFIFFFFCRVQPCAEHHVPNTFRPRAVRQQTASAATPALPTPWPSARWRYSVSFAILRITSNRQRPIIPCFAFPAAQPLSESGRAHYLRC